MPEIKTKATKESVTKFLKTVQPKEKQADAFALLKMFSNATGEKPVMWGSAIVGFGSYRNKTFNSEYDWFHVGFSPRKTNFAIYILEWKQENPKLLAKLGKYKRGGGCMYINRLSDIDEKVLANLIKTSYTKRKKLHK